jgi:hypothetical protein
MADFEEYHHIPITVPDVILFHFQHAIDKGKPSRLTPRVLHQPYEWRRPFSHIRDQCPSLASEVVLLKKILYTHTCEGYNFCMQHSCGTHLDQLLELAQRYYLERDYPLFALWLHSFRPPVELIQHRSSGLAEATSRTLRYQLEREAKVWTSKDAELLRRLKGNIARNDHETRLPDGGGMLPLLTQWLDRSLLENTTIKRYLMSQMCPIVPMWPPLKEPGLPFALRPAFCGRYRKAPDGTMISDLFAASAELSVFLGLDVGMERGRPRHRMRAATSVPRRRARSEVDTHRFGFARLPKMAGHQPHWQLEVAFPKMSSSQLLRRMRSRSLSSDRISDMFRLGALRRACPTQTATLTLDNYWGMGLLKHFCVVCGTYHLDFNRPDDVTPLDMYSSTAVDNQTFPSCQNCAEVTHRTSQCLARCGFCGAPNPILLSFADHSPGLTQHPHTAPTCPVAKRNRCKCVAFPQFHTAADCPVPCSRSCGSPCVPGGPKHPNAMTCRFRCCMCGGRGHSGQRCVLRTCRCGGKHLGQDCSWNPVCRAQSCEDYVCLRHCHECQEEAKPLIGFKCWRCQLAKQGNNAVSGG